MHTLLTQANDPPEGGEQLNHALEKVISEMELPEMLMGSTSGWGPLEQDDDQDQIQTTEAPEHLTVENILAGDALHGYTGRSRKRAYEDEDAEHGQEADPTLQNVYETLSPASLSPISDPGYKQKGSHAATPAASAKPVFKEPHTSHGPAQKVHKPAEAPAKLTNEFTMLQVADVKRRIINTHKLMLNFNFLKDGYSRTCVELKRTLLRLKQSEIHRTRLLQENEQLKRLVIEQNEKLNSV